MFKHRVVYTDHITPSEDLECYTFNAINELYKFLGDEVVDIRTSYSKEGAGFKVHTSLSLNGVAIDAHANDDDMYKSVSIMIEKLKSRLSTLKSKRTDIDRNLHNNGDSTNIDV